MRGPSAEWCGPRKRLLLGGIFLLALALRVLYLLQYSDCLLFSWPTADPREYHERALQIMGGDWFGSEVYFHSSPPYPYFIAAVFSLTGRSFFALYLVQALLGAANCVVIGLLAARLGSRPGLTAALAGLGAAGYGLLTFFDGMPLMIGMTIFFVDLALLLLLRFGDHGRGRDAFLAGLCFGIAALDKTNLLLFTPVALFFLASGFSVAPPRWRVRPIVLFLAALVLTMSPVAVRNYLVGGDLVLVSSNGGVNFYIGNNLEANGTFHVAPGSGLTDPGLYESSTRTAEQALGRALKPSEVSRYWAGRGLQFIRDEPAAFLRNLGRKLLFAFNGYEMPNYLNFYFVRRWYAPVLFALPVGFGMVFPLALLGVMLRSRTGHGQADRLYLGFLGCYLVSLLIFFVTARYRLPMVPLLIAFAAAGLAELITSWRRRSRRDLLRAGAVFACGTAFATLPVPRATYARELSDLARAHYYRHAYEEPAAKRHHLEQAVLLNKWSLETNPDLDHARHNLGLAFEALGYYSASVREYERTLEYSPGYRLSARKLSGARRRLRATGDLVSPEDVPRTPFEKARLRHREGDLEEAERLYLSVLAKDPYHHQAMNGFAELALAGDRAGLPRSLFKLYGRYPEWVSFAILLMNSVNPLIDDHIGPVTSGNAEERE